MTDGDERLLEWAVVGRIARTHGRSGQVIVNPETDFQYQRFRVGVVFLVRSEDRVNRATVTSVRFHQGRPILGFEGVETIDAAENYVGAELRVPLSELQALPTDMFYHHELIGCAVRMSDGRVIGSVAAVQGTANNSRLVIRTVTEEVLVPLAADICQQINVADRTIEIDPPEGLLELNTTSRSRSAG